MKKFIGWIFSLLYTLAIIITLTQLPLCMKPEMQCHTFYKNTVIALSVIAGISLIGLILTFFCKTTLFAILTSLVSFATNIWIVIETFAGMCDKDKMMKCTTVTAPTIRIMCIIAIIFFGVRFGILFFKNISKNDFVFDSNKN